MGRGSLTTEGTGNTGEVKIPTPGAKNAPKDGHPRDRDNEWGLGAPLRRAFLLGEICGGREVAGGGTRATWTESTCARRTAATLRYFVP